MIAEEDALAEKTALALQKQYDICAEAAASAQVLAEGPEEQQGRHLCLAVPFGQRNAAVTEHLHAQLIAKGRKLSCLVLTEAEGSYLKKYYGRK